MVINLSGEVGKFFSFTTTKNHKTQKKVDRGLQVKIIKNPEWRTYAIWKSALHFPYRHCQPGRRL